MGGLEHPLGRGEEGKYLQGRGKTYAKALRQRDNGEDWVKKPLWLEQSDKGRGNKKRGPQWGRIWVFTCTKGNHKRFKIGDDVIRFPLCKDPFLLM